MLRERHDKLQQQIEAAYLDKLEGRVTADLFDKAYYIKGPTDNPRGPRRGKGRVLKGASWKHKKPIPIVARNRAKEGYVNAMVGFRCAK